jgi:peptidoglycan hydrolase-like protein with peptidoglycan-binding domain
MRVIKALLATLITTVTAVTVNAAPAQAALPPCFDHSTEAWLIGNTGLVASWNLPSVVRENRFRAANINCKLQIGDRGAGVFVLQSALRECHGHTTLAVDGIFGPLTRNAVIWEQARNGFPPADVDGIYGPQTRSVMRFPLFINGVFSRDCKDA